MRTWLREGGRKKTIRWILVQSGCIAEDEDVEIEDDGEEES